jgi:hypothetical protein
MANPYDGYVHVCPVRNTGTDGSTNRGCRKRRSRIRNLGFQGKLARIQYVYMYKRSPDWKAGVLQAGR